MQIPTFTPTGIAILLVTLFPAPSVHSEPKIAYSSFKPIKALVAPAIPAYTELALATLPYSPPETFANPYPVGQCTWLAASMKGNIPVWGDADQWPAHARAAGVTVSDTPLVGSLGVERVGNHVTVVTSVNPDSTVTVEEGNYDLNGSIRSFTYSTSKFIYIWV